MSAPLSGITSPHFHLSNAKVKLALAGYDSSRAEIVSHLLADRSFVAPGDDLTKHGKPFGFDLDQVDALRRSIREITTEPPRPSPHAGGLNAFRRELVHATADAVRHDPVALMLHLYLALMERQADEMMVRVKRVAAEVPVILAEAAALTAARAAAAEAVREPSPDMKAFNARVLDLEAEAEEANARAAEEAMATWKPEDASTAGQYLLRCLAVQAVYNNMGTYQVVLEQFARIVAALKLIPKPVSKAPAEGKDETPAVAPAAPSAEQAETPSPPWQDGSGHFGYAHVLKMLGKLATEPLERVSEGLAAQYQIDDLRVGQIPTEGRQHRPLRGVWSARPVPPGVEGDEKLDAAWRRGGTQKADILVIGRVPREDDRFEDSHQALGSLKAGGRVICILPARFADWVPTRQVLYVFVPYVRFVTLPREPTDASLSGAFASLNAEFSSSAAKGPGYKDLDRALDLFLADG